MLRSHVFLAWSLRGTDEYEPAIEDVVDGWMLFPAIEAKLALEEIRAERRENLAAALQVLRETSHLVPDESRVLADLEALAAPEDDSCSVCRRPNCHGGPECVKVGRRRLWLASNPARRVA